MQSIIFCNFSTCVEESNYTNDYKKARREVSGNWRLLSFCFESSLISIICQRRTLESKQYTQYTKLKRNACYEMFNTFLRRNEVHLDWKDILLVVEVPPWCLHYVWYRKKLFGIWVFLKAQEINFLDPLKVNINIIYISIWTFFILRNSSFRIWPCRIFFLNILPQHIRSNPINIF